MTKAINQFKPAAAGDAIAEATRVEARFDSVVLSKIGWSEEEARDFITKHQAYLNSLSANQYRVVSGSMPSWQEAATSIHSEMTAADLQDFVARRGETPAPASALCLIAVTAF